jgi:3-oxoacyl-[acyl-carrier-protein] synthase II
MRSAPAAITGLGAVSGFGLGKAPLWNALLAGRTAIRAFDRFDAAAYRTRLAAAVASVELPPAGPRRERLTLCDRFALAATREALVEAGLPQRLDQLPEPARVGVYFGSSTGGMLEAEEYFAGAVGAGPARRRGRLGLLTAQMPGCPAEAVARRHGVRGPVLTVSSACSSATLALGLALDALRSGEIDLALAGGADSFCRLTFAGFNSLRAVDSLPCRPFRLERQGMSLGEGAAVLVLERADDARRRGATPIAALAGAGASCDAHHMTAPEPTGAGIRAAVEAALDDAGLDAGAIDFLNAHGTGTPHNDAAEARMIAALFGARAAAVPVTSTKGAVGHYLGAAGAVEALATVLCLAEARVHPTPGGGTVEAALGVDLVVGAPRLVPGARHALSTNLAFGGANAACVLSSAETL